MYMQKKNLLQRIMAQLFSAVLAIGMVSNGVSIHVMAQEIIEWPQSVSENMAIQETVSDNDIENDNELSETRGGTFQ